MSASPILHGLAAAATLLLITLALPARAQDDNAQGHGATSLRLTSPAGGLWLRGKLLGTTSLAETANLGSSADPSWRLLGSYDLPRATGLRASGGMIGVSRRTAFGSGALLDGQRWDSGLTRGWIEGTRVQDTAAQASHISVPYAGISYTTAGGIGSERGLPSSAWSFNIDLGVMALAPRSTVRLGASGGSADRLDDMVRELRLSPLLQLGISYSF